MDDAELKHIAAQLACPSGEAGHVVADKMNDGNVIISARAIEALAPRAGECIAEIGPGNGRLTIPVVEAIGDGGRFVGLEMSPDMARQAAATLDPVNSAEIDMRVGDCMTVAVEDGSLDGLFAVNLLYFIDDLAGFSSRVARWLKPGGRAVFGIRSEAALRAMPFTRFGFNIRSLEEVTGTLQENGFGEVGSQYFDEGTTTAFGGEILVDAQIITARPARLT